MSNEATVTTTADPAPAPAPEPAPEPPSTWAKLRGAGRWLYVHVLTPIGRLLLALGDILKAAVMAAAAEAQRTDAPSFHPEELTSSREIALALRGAAGSATLSTAVWSLVGVVALALLHGVAFITPYLFPIPVLGWLISFGVQAAIKIAAKLHGGDPFARQAAARAAAAADLTLSAPAVEGAP